MKELYLLRSKPSEYHVYNYFLFNKKPKKRKNGKWSAQGWIIFFCTEGFHRKVGIRLKNDELVKIKIDIIERLK
jgi:hypothetical protein